MAPLGKKQRGNAFELLTELFLKVDPIYRSKLKEVWHESDIPPNVRHKLGLPSPEIGVDLVAQTKSGEFWAIQCKYHHDPSRAEPRCLDTVVAVHIADALIAECFDSPDAPVVELDEELLTRLGVTDKLPHWRELAEAEILTTE